MSCLTYTSTTHLSLYLSRLSLHQEVKLKVSCLPEIDSSCVIIGNKYLEVEIYVKCISSLSCKKKSSTAKKYFSIFSF